MYESIFVALAEEAYSKKALDIKIITEEKVRILKENEDFISASQKHTSSAKNVQLRIKNAKELL